jgi:hypothetical protein
MYTTDQEKLKCVVTKLTLVDAAFVTVFSRPTSFREMHRTAYTLLSKPFEKEG